jgi:DNA gyrase subunit A
MSVIIGRALPDVRDGLKPVHRRILFSMHEQSNTWNRAYKKSARIVGDVIGKYHPHGDQAVYDALVRMAQDFSMRMPLIDGQGNFGSVDGDPPAAMRYTEVRMARLCSELMADIEKQTVDFLPNYDGNEEEPVVLPARIPNLLINGSEGIAVGMATRVPPHNLGEVVRAVIHLIDHPDATLDDLARIIPGPDFPTAGLIYGIDGIREAYETGRGVIRIRARANVETDDRTGKESIIVTELPFQVNKARLLEKFAELVREKAVEGITDLRDESDRNGMRMVIELRRDVNAQVVLNHLFKKTALETSFGINMLAIVAGQPQVLPLRDILTHFIDFRRDVVTRRSEHELKQAEKRLHILRGLRRAVDMIDEVIKTIRASADVDEAREGLMNLLSVDEIQAQAILDLRLQRLTNLEINKLDEEIGEVTANITDLLDILQNESRLLAVVREELQSILDQYDDARRTEILPFSGELSIEDLIADEDEVVTLTHGGYIKRTKIAEYRTQKRGGKGLKGMETKEEDFVEDVWVTTTHSSLLVFGTSGWCYPLRVHEIPAGGRNTRGKPIVNMIPIKPEEKVAAVLPFKDFEEGKYIVTCTRDGIVKKTSLPAYQNIHAGGIIGVVIPEGDELITARLCEAGDQMLLVSSDGQSIRFDAEEVRPTGRATQGVTGMRFRDSDHLVSMLVIPREDIAREEVALDEDTGKTTSRRTILAVTERGYGKRTFLSEYRPQGRGGLGIITIDTSERNGRVAGARFVSSDEELILITDGGQIIRSRVSDISVTGRNTMGVRLISLGDDETVVGMSLFAERETAGDEGDAEPAGAAD